MEMTESLTGRTPTAPAGPPESPATVRPAEAAASSLDHVCRGAAELMRAAGTPLRRLTVRIGDTQVDLEWPEPQAPNGAVVSPPPVAVVVGGEPPEPDARHVVTAPHLGTFYRSPEPGSSPFVSEGDLVQRGQQIGILEAMKLMNPVEADRDGRVVEILAADGSAVEFEQPLLALLPQDRA